MASLANRPAPVTMSRVNNPAVGIFEARLPAWPWCADNVAADGVQRLPVAAALRKKLIQPNSARVTGALCFDIDRPWSGIAWMDANVLPPNIVLMNPSNGHAHYIYLLESPVITSNIAQLRPILYLSGIQYALREALGADKGYTGLLVKNPRHSCWQHTCWRLEPYSLHELADKLDLPSPSEIRRISHSADYSGIGRNVTVFMTVKTRAYSVIRQYWKPDGEKHFFSAILEQCRAVNAEFPVPLPDSEIRRIARSICKWVWTRFSPAKFRASQAAKGRKGGQSKGASKRAECLEQARAMHAAGKSQREIAKALGVGQKTVSRWLKRV